MFLGTDSQQTVFWIEPTIEEVLKNFERNPSNKFFQIVVQDSVILLKKINFTKEATEVTRTFKTRIATVEGKEINWDVKA